MVFTWRCGEKSGCYFQGELSVLRSEPYFLEVMPKGIDKAASLKRLLEYLGKDRSQMIAFGDGFNDRSMLEYAGLGVAMQNGRRRSRR